MIYNQNNQLVKGAVWGCSPFIRLFHKRSIWHETLHKFGISYSEDWRGNCNNNCLMNFVPRTDELCPNCYDKLHEFLEPHQKVRVLGVRKLR